MGLIANAPVRPVKFSDAEGAYAPFAGLLVDLPCMVAENPDPSRQIPPGCALHPKLPLPATQLEEPELAAPPLVDPSAPLLAPGIAFCAPKLPRPADQLDAPLPSGDGFAAGELAVAPGCGVAFCWAPAGWVCALARPGSRTAANTAIESRHLCFALFMVSILLRPTISWQDLEPP
jgi:hypothetical protein